MSNRSPEVEKIKSKGKLDEDPKITFENETNLENESTKKPKDREKRETNWYRFEVLSPNTAIIRGTYAMTDAHFKQRSRGNQATASSVIAIVFGRLFEPKEWTKSFVDRILEHGDKLYRISATRNRVNPGVYLTTDLVYPEFYIDDYKCLICVEGSSLYGNLFSASIGCPDFSEGLQRFFKLNDAGVITAQGSSVAVWRNPKAGFLYYDPLACGPNGRRIREGVACAMRFKTIGDLTELFLQNMDRRYDSRYCIDKVNVLRVVLINRGDFLSDRSDHLVVDKNVLQALNPVDLDDDDGKLDCTKPAPKKEKPTNIVAATIRKEPLSIQISNYKIDARLANEPMITFEPVDTGYSYRDMEVNIPSTFRELSDGIAILHGWTHESSEMYKGKGSQNVANCVVSIAMKNVAPVKTWLKPRLDEILVQGDALNAQIKAEKPTIKAMTGNDLNDTMIKIEDKKLWIDVDLLTVVGTISSKIPSVLNIRQALEEFFLVNKDGVVECSSMALAIWTQDDYYYTFDPRQCDPNGVRILQEKGKSGKGGKKDAGGGEKTVQGKCCVMRFPDLDSLVAIFLKNIDPAKKNDRFIIRSITIINDRPGIRAWKEFQPGEPGKTWILRGGISNRDDSFEPESQGVQGVAMPVVGLVNASSISPDKWTKETVDEAVRDGDNYYNWCIPPEVEENRELLVGTLKKTLYVKNRKVKIDLLESAIVGDLTAKDDDKMANLSRGIVQFFETRQYGMIEAKNLSVAVCKFEEEQKDKTKVTFYYLYDANPRDEMGKRNTDIGEEYLKACVVRAVDPAELARLIELNIDPATEGSNDFVIHEVKIVSSSDPMTDEEIAVDKTIPAKPELNFYTALGEDGGCLNGSFDQSNEMFKYQTKDKQQAANALVTLAMRKLYNPHLWYREVVDDVLKIGDKVTQNNIVNLAAEEPEDEAAELGTSRRDYLLPTEIAGEFDIGVNRVTINLEEEITSGKISELAAKLEEFFGDNSMGIFRQEKTMLPIWKEGDVYFTMDPRGRDGNGIPKDKDGSATVLWFTNIPALASSLQLSVAKADGEFSIDSVQLTNIYETRVAETERLKKTTSGEDLWHHFPKKSDGVWELEGSLSIEDERFDENNRKQQTASVAMIGAIFSKAYEPRQWTNEVLDEVIIIGDKLHSQSLARLGRTSPPRINEMTKELFLSNRRIDLAIEDSVEAGDIAGRPPKVQDLRTGLEKFFNRYQVGALTFFDHLNLTIWKHGDFYYCLVPFTAVNTENQPEGRPRIGRFANCNVFADYLREIVGHSGDYVISAIDVVDWDKRPPWKFDPSPAVRPSNLPSLNAYYKLPGLEGEARAILRAGAHQGSSIFPEKIRNKQTAANCVVALAMSVVKNPATWTMKTLDEVLVIGTRVHRETAKARSSKGKFRPHEIVRVFHVGVNVMTADVDESTISGPVAVPPPEPEVKGKGKAKKKKPPKPKKAKKGKAKRVPPPPPPPIYLEEALSKFFEKNRAGILVTGRYMTAIWRDQGVYFMYDPRERGNHGLSDNSAGTSCCMWFACLQPLYDLIFANIDDDEKYGHYDICRVIARTTVVEPLPCPASFRPILECNVPSIPVPMGKRMPMLDVEIMTEYNIADDGIEVLRGNLHMNDRTFDLMSRGLQSTGIAAVAIVVGALHVPSIWTTEIVDAILKYGDLLHKDTVKVINPGARNLSPTELLSVFVVGDFRANIQIRHTTAGILLEDDLRQSLRLFFRNNCSGILHTGNMAVAVMQHYGKFYLFDPLARNEFGRPSFEGKACVVKFQNIEKLASHFVTNCNYKLPTVYTINAVNVLNLRFFGDSRSECPQLCEEKLC